MIPKMTLRASVGGLDEKSQQTLQNFEGVRSQEQWGLHRRSDHLICSLADCSTCRNKGSIEGLAGGRAEMRIGALLPLTCLPCP